MLANYYTNPLMGAKFQEFRNYIMGWKNMKELVKEINDSNGIKERVGILENNKFYT